MPPANPQPAPRPLWRSVAWGCVLGALLACAAEIGRMIVTRNQHVVVPGRVYRSAQLTPDQLETYVRRHDIRTVINLRGRPFNEWYPAQAQATQALGISQEDVTTSANRLPAPGEVRRLIEIFDRSEHPILLHCQQGADRTGLAAAMYLMLYTDADYATARHQCSPRFGHLRIHTAASMDEFFDQYEEWLTANRETHSPAVLRRWATTEYCPGPGRALLELVSGPGDAEVGKPVLFRVRAYNTSREPWQFRAGTRAGVHAWYVVQRPDGQASAPGYVGFFDRTVAPGGYVDLEIPVEAPAVPGKYRLFVDLSQRNVDFRQYGSEALTHDWDARNPAPPRGR
ncbi:MAG TPA: tyrosine-protein phosphatase [Gemmataceae bacterium]|nr:tyrosine-protein phosphatase [Gemmataceae bacterium]